MPFDDKFEREFRERQSEMHRRFEESHREHSETVAITGTGIFVFGCIIIAFCCCCICYSLCKNSKAKEKDRKLQKHYMEEQERRLQEDNRKLDQISQLQQPAQYYPPPPTMPPVQQMYPPPIGSQVMAPQLPPSLPPSAMPSPSYTAQIPSAGPRTMPGWNTDALQSKPQPGILITPKEDPTTKSVTINMAPAVVRPVSPPKRNARPLPSLRERANQKLNRSSSSSRSGSYASERDSRSGSRRRH